MRDRPLLPTFVLLWSSGYVVGAVAIQVADPLPLLAARFVLASLVAVPLALRHGRWRGAPIGRLAVAGILLQVVQFGGVYGGFALGVPAALSALVMLGLSPLVTTGLAVAIGKERGDTRLWAGLAVGLLGVAISLAPELGSARVGVGIAVTLLGMLGLASGTVVQKHWAGAADVRVAAAVQSSPAPRWSSRPWPSFGGRLDVSLQLVLSLGWLAWGMGIVTLLLLVHLLRGHAASTVGALLLVVPAVTAIASAPALGEALHPASLLGMVVAMGGVGAVIRRETSSPRPSPGGPARRDRRTRRRGRPGPARGPARSSAGAVCRRSAPDRGRVRRRQRLDPLLDRRLRRHPVADDERGRRAGGVGPVAGGALQPDALAARRVDEGALVAVVGQVDVEVQPSRHADGRRVRHVLGERTERGVRAGADRRAGRGVDAGRGRQSR